MPDNTNVDTMSTTQEDSSTHVPRPKQADDSNAVPVVADSDEDNNNSSGDADDTEGIASDDNDEAPYTGQEWTLADLFTDFFKFLATLHYDPADLRLPPSEGWPIDLLPKSMLTTKSPDVIELMRHMPYLVPSPRSTHMHYKCIAVDYHTPEKHSHAERIDGSLTELFPVFHWSEGKVDHSHLLMFAQGYESGGRSFIVDVLHGEITEDVNRSHTSDPVDAAYFFYTLKNAFECLDLIPCPGRETKEADDIPERTDRISESEVRAQTSEWYPGTDLDWQFVRQVHRDHGWPEAFRRDDAIKFIDDFMERDKEKRGEWELAFH